MKGRASRAVYMRLQPSLLSPPSDPEEREKKKGAKKKKRSKKKLHPHKRHVIAGSGGDQGHQR